MKMEIAKQFFILGNPRSGTSMFRMMLNSHPEIVVPPECGFAHWLSNEYLDKDFSQKSVREQYIDALSKTKKFETWNINLDFVRKLLEGHSVSSYTDAVRCTYMAYGYGRDSQVSLVGDKNNYYIKHCNELKAIFPDAKFVLIVRDGRDVACSYLELSNSSSNSQYKPNLPSEIEEIAKEWKTNNGTVLEAFGDNVHIIRYEDLVTTPEVELSKVCRFLGVEFHQDMLAFYKKNDEPKDFLGWKSKTLEKVDSKNLKKYKEKLSEEQIEIFDVCAGSMLKRFGYV